MPGGNPSGRIGPAKRLLAVLVVLALTIAVVALVRRS
jgi:hypothetical protein